MTGYVRGVRGRVARFPAELLAELVRQGVTVQQVAQLTGLQVKAVYYHLRNYAWRECYEYEGGRRGPGAASCTAHIRALAS